MVNVKLNPLARSARTFFHHTIWNCRPIPTPAGRPRADVKNHRIIITTPAVFSKPWKSRCCRFYIRRRHAPAAATATCSQFIAYATLLENRSYTSATWRQLLHLRRQLLHRRAAAYSDLKRGGILAAEERICTDETRADGLTRVDRFVPFRQYRYGREIMQTKRRN